MNKTLLKKLLLPIFACLITLPNLSAQYSNGAEIRAINVEAHPLLMRYGVSYTQRVKGITSLYLNVGVYAHQANYNFQSGNVVYDYIIENSPLNLEALTDNLSFQFSQQFTTWNIGFNYYLLPQKRAFSKKRWHLAASFNLAGNLPLINTNESWYEYKIVAIDTVSNGFFQYEIPPDVLGELTISAGFSSIFDFSKLNPVCVVALQSELEISTKAQLYLGGKVGWRWLGYPKIEATATEYFDATDVVQLKAELENTIIGHPIIGIYISKKL